MKRRTFLKQGSSAAMVPFVWGGFRMEALAQHHLMNGILANCEDRVLVLVQMNGGNDGLNTLLPLDQYTNLAAARPDLLIPANKALNFDSALSLGLHPAMPEINSMYQANQLGVLQSVGYPEPNFSHFRSTDIWTSASPSDVNWTTGWMGRYLDTIFPNYPTNYPNANAPDPLAITVGSVVSQTCQGPVTSMSMAIPNLNSFLDLSSGSGDPPPNNRYGYELGYLRELMSQTNQYFGVVETAADNGNNLATYPDTRLAAQLKIVANLISGGLKTAIYCVSIGGFDTHANQVVNNDPLVGEHTDLLTEVSGALAAFQDDLKLLGLEDRVLGMTFSEFGRRIRNNGSYGTDHGAAAPLFVFGKHVNPIVHGTNPVIGTNLAVQDNVPMQFDFRSVYGSILEDWFCVPEATIKSLLFDDYQHLPILQTPATAVEAPKVIQQLTNYPNPFDSYTTLQIQFEAPTEASIRIFNNEGRAIQTLAERTFPAGTVKLEFDASGLAGGMYYARIQAGNQQAIHAMVKR